MQTVLLVILFFVVIIPSAAYVARFIIGTEGPDYEELEEGASLPEVVEDEGLLAEPVC